MITKPLLAETAETLSDIPLDNQGKYLGQLIRFKHQVSPNDPEGMLPRFPSWQGFRHKNDISE